MRHSSKDQAIASGAGVALLVFLVAGAAHWYSPENFWPTAALAWAFTFLLAFVVWSGALWRGQHSVDAPKTWGEWVALFFGGTFLSALFLFIDLQLADGDPGISAIFTMAAIAMTLIALPSALRAWLLARLAAKRDRA